MHHDFKRSPSDVRRDRSGKACYGYMDYKQDTNYWSKCSVEFLTNQNKSCLKKLGGGTVITDPPRKLSCYFIEYLLTSFKLYLVSFTIINYFIFLFDAAGCDDNPNYAKNCKKFAWACKDSRYPWFRNTCKSTCNNC